MENNILHCKIKRLIIRNKIKKISNTRNLNEQILKQNNIKNNSIYFLFVNAIYEDNLL